MHVFSLLFDGYFVFVQLFWIFFYIEIKLGLVNVRLAFFRRVPRDAPRA